MIKRSPIRNSSGFELGIINVMIKTVVFGAVAGLVKESLNILWLFQL